MTHLQILERLCVTAVHQVFWFSPILGILGRTALLTHPHTL